MVLEIESCGIEQVPREVLTEPKNDLNLETETLDLSGKDLTSLPHTYDHVFTLKHLDLSRNLLTCLPSWLNDLVRLRTLDLSQNPLTIGGLEEAIVDRFGKKCRSLRRINLSHCSLVTPCLPASIFNAKDNMELIVGTKQRPRDLKLLNRISSLKNVGLSLGLVKLVASGINLGEVPDEIGQLKCLRHLDISDNALYHLPSALALLDRLTYLDASSNYLNDLVYNIQNMKALEILKMAHNSVEWITEDFGRLKSSLRHLDLYSNNLSLEVLSGLSNMNLDQLDLGQNKVSLKEIRWDLKIEDYCQLESKLRREIHDRDRLSPPSEPEVPEESLSSNYSDSGSDLSNLRDDDDYDCENKDCQQYSPLVEEVWTFDESGSSEDREWSEKISADDLHWKPEDNSFAVSEALLAQETESIFKNSLFVPYRDLPNGMASPESNSVENYEEHDAASENRIDLDRFENAD